MWGEMTEAEIFIEGDGSRPAKAAERFPGQGVLVRERAAGTAGERSDFDIGIDAGKAPAGGDDKLDRGRVDLLPDLRKVEVVDFSDVTDDFRRVAMGKTKELL